LTSGTHTIAFNSTRDTILSRVYLYDIVILRVS